MKHLIVGSGTVGKSTGTMLKVHGEDVTYYDVNADIILELKKKGENVATNIKTEMPMYTWICTPELELEQVMKTLLKRSVVIIRCTTQPKTIDKLEKQFSKSKFTIIHLPEFLKEVTAIEDTLNPDRIIIGSNDCSTESIELKYMLKKFFPNIPIIYTDTKTSEMSKLTANGWLGTQISFWNEIKEVCDEIGIDSQIVSNAVTLDKRISKYGSNMLGKPYGGKCIPKDVKQLIETICKWIGKSILLKSVDDVNKKMMKK